MTGKVTAILLLLSLACREQQQSKARLWELRLHGHRDIYRVDGADLPCFDRESLPRVEVRGTTPVPDHLVLELVGIRSSARIPLTRIREAKGASLLAASVAGPEGDFDRARVVARDVVLAEIRILWRRPPSSIPVIRALGALDAKVEAELRAAVMSPGREAWERMQIAFALGSALRRAGRPGEASVTFERAATFAQRIGAWTAQVEAEIAAAHSVSIAHDFQTATQHLERARSAMIGDDPETRGRLAFAEGALAFSTGQYHVARASFEEVIEIGEAIGMNSMTRVAVHHNAWLDHAMGRFEDALVELAREESFFVDAKDRKTENFGLFLVLRGWLRLEAMRRGRIAWAPRKVERDFSQAESVFERIPATAQIPNVRANLAWLAILERDLEKAEGILDTLDAAAVAKGNSLRWFEPWLRASLAEARGDHQRAVAAAKELIVEIGSRPVGESAHFAAMSYALIGRAAIAREDRDAAIRAFDRGIALLERVSEALPLERGRTSFSALARDLERPLVSQLVEAGRIWEAISIVDATQSRILRGLSNMVRPGALDADARARWLRALGRYTLEREALETTQRSCRTRALDQRRGCDRELEAHRVAASRSFEAMQAALGTTTTAPSKLPALPDDRAILWLFPMHEGWRLFLRRGRDAPTTWRAASPLDGVEHHLRDVAHLYVVPDAERPRPLLDPEALGVESASIIPFASWLTRPLAAVAPRDLVVADPTEDLPGAAREAKVVLGLLRDTTSVSGAKATRKRVLSELRRGVRVFHFAGHGLFDARDPWRAHLELAGGSALTLEDLFAHQPRARLVVLSACRSGPSAPGRVALPHAWLLAGGGAVLATSRDISDRNVGSFVQRFYGAGGASPPGKAFRAAVDASKRDGERVWRDFVLYGHASLNDAASIADAQQDRRR